MAAKTTRILNREIRCAAGCPGKARHAEGPINCIIQFGTNGLTMKRKRISNRRQKRELVIPKPPRNGNIKVTREGWLNCARVALIEDGIEGVKVDRLAKRVKVTRGGFYHHFKNHNKLDRKSVV